jgi:excisionase family DNA binding protein
VDRLRDKKFSTMEAAGLLGVTSRQVLDLIHEGDLAAYRIGKKYIVCEGDLVEFLNASRVIHPNWRPRVRPRFVPKAPLLQPHLKL